MTRFQREIFQRKSYADYGTANDEVRIELITEAGLFTEIDSGTRALSQIKKLMEITHLSLLCSNSFMYT